MQAPLPQGITPDSSPTSAGNDYRPTEEETARIKQVEKLFGQAKKAKELHDQKWLDYYRFFRGRQWPEKRPSYRHSEVVNFIFSEVVNILVLLTDNRPDIEVLPQDPTDLEFSEIITTILKANWDNHLWSVVVAEAITDASVYGTAVGEVPWEPTLCDGLGDMGFGTVDPFYFFPDPNAHAFVNDKHCDYAMTAIPTPVRRVKAQYPDVADFLKADLADLSSSYTDKEYLDEVRYKSPTDNRVLIDSDRSIKTGKPNQVLVVTLHEKSDELIEEELEGDPDPATGLPTKQFQTKKKFPNGRKTVIANGVLCEDGPNPYDDGKFPFATLVDNVIPRQIWGVGEVEQLRSAQMILNKILSYTLDTMSLMGNPIWLVPTNSGIETDNLTNQPGLAVEYNPEGKPQREPGVPMPPYVMELFNLMSEKIWAKLSSTTEVSKGVAPSDNASGYAIAQLQEAAQTRLRGKGRNLEVFLKQVGDLMVSRILQFYTVPRIIRLTNNGNATQFFQFHISPYQDESGETYKVAQVTQYVQDPSTGQFVPQSPEQYTLKSRLDLKINVSSSLPYAKLDARQTAEKLYDKGIIDAEEYLTQLDYPRKEKIIMQLKERLAAQQMQAQGAQHGIPPAGAPGAAPPGPGGPPGRPTGPTP